MADEARWLEGLDERTERERKEAPMTARDEAVAVIADFLTMPTPEVRRSVARSLLDAALPVLLDGLDVEALAQVVFSWAVPNAGDFRDDHESVVERALAGADAVLAYLRDEWSR